MTPLPGKMVALAVFVGLLVGDAPSRGGASGNASAALGGGGSIAWQSERRGMDKDIYLMAPDGTQVRAVTHASSEDLYPAWSPSGRRLAFESNRAGTFDIWTMNAAGRLRRITSSPAQDTQPAWSPDGKHIAFAANATGDWDIYLVDALGSDAPVDLTNNKATDRGATWSPDGTRIAFTSDRSGDYEVYTMAPDGGDVTRLTTNGGNSHPSWAPDGAHLLFSSNRSGWRDIWEMAADGSNEVDLTNTSSREDFGSSWSPDGNRVVFETLVRRRNWEIYIMQANGTEQTNLTRASALDQRGTWQPVDPVSPDLTPPSVIIAAPTDGSTVRAGASLQMSGTATDPGSGVARVQVAILATLRDGTFRWWNGSRFVARSRHDPPWVSTRGIATWACKLGVLPRSGSGTPYRSYRAFVRGTDVLWNATTTFSRGTDLVRFQVR